MPFWIDLARKVATTWRRLIRPLRDLSQHGGAILGLCGIMLLWAGTFESLSVSRRQALQGATDNAANLTRAFEEDIIRSIKTIDQTLLYVRDTYERNPAGFNIAAWAKSTRLLSDITLQVAMIDKSGMMNGSTAGSARIDLSDREHFRVHRDRPEDQLFISKPVLGRATGKWSLQLSRKMLAPDGSFDGVVVVSLDPQYLSRFYASVDLGAHGVVTLVGTDGIVRARASAGDTGVGQSLNGGRLMAAYPRAPSGTFETVSPIDRIKRIYTYRAVNSYPLIVVVGVAEDDILANYRASQRSNLAVVMVLTLLLLLVTAKIVRHQAGLRTAQGKLRASEAAYAQKSNLLEAAVENMSQGIVMIDADRRVQVCNRRAMEKLDLPEALMAGQPLFDDVLRWHWEHGEYGADGGDVEPWLRQQVLAGGVIDSEQTYERTRPNGRVLEIQSTPLRGGGVVRTFTDITTRRAAETVLRAARDEADRAARAKSEFLAMMSHEIRSPMHGMLGIIELLRDTDLQPEQTSMVDLALESATSLLRILNDVLDFSKIDAGAIGISAQPSAIRDLLRALVEATAVIAERKGLRLHRVVAEDVPAQIIVDPLRLRQILGNLLGNAIKFTAAGSIELTVSSALLPSGAPALAFAVSDSGIGMAPDVLQRLFEPFMQEDASTAKTFGGTGLGLSISRRLARLLGGDITVASNLGAGSVFTLTIPLLAAVAPDPAPPHSAVVPTDDRALQGLRVLAAEDQAINRWLMTRQFDRFGVLLTLAEDGLQALAALAADTFDLLVTDCHMPGMDGIELTRRIRAAEHRTATPRMPILGLTADVTAETRAKCLAAGMDDVTSKPINLSRLGQVLRQMMAQPGSHDGVSVEAHGALPDLLFDHRTYQELFAEEPADGGEWLAAYVESAASASRLIRDSVAAGDRNGLKAAAHDLAGGSLSAGAMRAGLLARILEAAAPDAAMPRLQHLETEISTALDATFDEIRLFVATKRVPVA